MPDTHSPKVTMADENFPEVRSEIGKNPPTRRWTCPDDRTIAEYVDGALRQDGKARVESHLAKCERCRLIVADVVKLQREIDLPAPPSEIGRSVVRLAPPASRRSHWFWIPAAAMASIALVAMTISLLREPQKLRVMSPPSPSAPMIAKAEPATPRSTPVPDVVRKSSAPEQLPVVLFPQAGSMTAGEHLQFKWTEVSRSRNYEVRVVTSDGDLVWEGQTMKSDLRLPDDVVLKAGTYFVWITANLADGRTAKSSPVQFIVKD